MKQIIYNIAIFIAVCLPGQGFGQVSGLGNQERQPAWGPAGYDYAENYYIPDLNLYYNVPSAKFVYYDNGLWVTSATLPQSVGDFNLYSARKVVLNTPEPWKTHEAIMAQYSIKPDCNNQLAQRDAYDMWRFHVTTYSGFMPRCVTTTQQTGNTSISNTPATGLNVSSAKSFSGYKAKSVKPRSRSICARKSASMHKRLSAVHRTKPVKNTNAGNTSSISMGSTNSYSGYKTTCVAPEVTTGASCVRNGSTDTWSCTSASSYSGYKPYRGTIIPQSPCTSCTKQFSPDDYSCVTTERFSGYKPYIITRSTKCKNPALAQ